MKKLKSDLYILVKGSLRGKTIEEKLEDIKDRIFMNEMVDNWTREDYEFNDVLYQLKDELESELNGKQN